MSQELSTNVQQKQSALAVMASRYSVEPDKLLNTLKNTVFKGATNEELLTLVVVANQYGLSPLTKEIYGFPAKGGGIVPVVGVDGWIRMVNDHPQTDGVQFEAEYQDGKLFAVKCRIWRKDRQHPIEVTEYLSECRRNTEPWKMEHRMLRHKALIQAARVAFGFSGIHDEDEARDIAAGRTINATVVDKPTPDLFAAPKISQHGNSVQGEPATGLSPKTVEDSASGFQPCSTSVVETSFSLAEPDPTDIGYLMQTNGVTIDDLNRVIQETKLDKREFEKVADMPKKLRDTLVKSWGDVLSQLGK